jgi:hypothetical protein
MYVVTEDTILLEEQNNFRQNRYCTETVTHTGTHKI